MDPPRQKKRVESACDHCRQKRLRCTSERERPCLSCQLYRVDCTSNSARKRRTSKESPGRPAKRSRESPTPAQQQQPSSANGQSRDYPHLVSSANPTPVAADEATGQQQTPEGAGLFDFALDITGDSQPSPQNSVPLSKGFVDDRNHAAPGISELEQFSSQAVMDFPFVPWGADGDLTSPSHMFSSADLSFGVPISAESISSQSSTTVDPLLYTPVILPDTSPATSPSSDASLGKVSGIEGLHEDLPTEPRLHQSSASILPGLFIRKNASDCNFIGLDSTGATMAACLKDALQGEHKAIMPYSLRLLIEAGPHIDEAHHYPTYGIPQPKLPSKSFAKASADAYFRYSNGFCPVVEHSDFDTLFDRLYSSEVNRVTLLEASLFYLVVAIGALLNSRLTGKKHEEDGSAQLLYQKAWLNINASLSFPCVTSLQVILLHVIWLVHFGKLGICWTLCGLAARTAQSIGLHRRSPLDFGYSEQNIRLRSNLWWIIYMFDGFLSLTQGRAPLPADLDLDDDIMPRSPDSNDPSTSLVAYDIFVFRIWFSRVQNRFCNLLHSSCNGYNRLEKLAQIDRELLNWRDSIPVEARPEEEILVAPEIQDLVVTMHLEYFNLMRAIHWTSVTLAVPRIASGHGGQYLRLQASESICLAAARSFIQALNASNEGRIGEFPGRLLTDHYISALFILYRGIFKNPTRHSTRADLEYFRAGKVHLERDMHQSTYTKSLEALCNEMLKSAEDLLKGL